MPNNLEGYSPFWLRNLCSPVGFSNIQQVCRSYRRSTDATCAPYAALTTASKSIGPDAMCHRSPQMDWTPSEDRIACWNTVHSHENWNDLSSTRLWSGRCRAVIWPASGACSIPPKRDRCICCIQKTENFIKSSKKKVFHQMQSTLTDTTPRTAMPNVTAWSASVRHYQRKASAPDTVRPVVPNTYIAILQTQNKESTQWPIMQEKLAFSITLYVRLGCFKLVKMVSITNKRCLIRDKNCVLNLYQYNDKVSRMVYSSGFYDDDHDPKPTSPCLISSFLKLNYWIGANKCQFYLFSLDRLCSLL